MLSTEDNELLCRVGPGTPMGAFMREYWLPAFAASELPEADGAPMRLRLLGENLIAFHTTSGKFGLIANNCPHRGASLFFGRNEEEGLRCVYHGWKFDVDGSCIDMPNEPAESDFKNKVKAVAYPTQERNGIVWAYMGPRSAPPPLPEWLPNLDTDCQFWMRLQESNWLQALEGDIDTVHAFFLHAGHYTMKQSLPGSDAYYITQQRHGRFVAKDHAVGASYAAVRDADPGTEYWRMGHFLFPFYTMNAPGLLGVKNQSLAWVPLDDYNTMVWTVGRQQPLPPETETVGGFKAGYVRRDPIGKYDPYGARNANGVPVRKFESSTDWLGRFRPIANQHNDYLIDRDLQRTMGTYSGIPQIAQDAMAQESMGPIYDRRQERLGTSDVMIIRTRRRLLDAVRGFAKGTPAPGVDQPEQYRMRSGGVIVKAGVNGLDEMDDLFHDRVPLAEFRERWEAVAH
ncbi:MAG: Rieske 2Fe-2S domain-containing protein [Chloroflexi bacterium]|nr:Rieske 2Fe-2S domain-containing protein [Chloroflexota bacterium]